MAALAAGTDALVEPIPIDLRPPGGRATAGRAAQLARSSARHLGPKLARRAVGRGRLSPPALARPLRKLCEDMGATFLKYGQLVASAETLFGPELSSEFRSTLDTGPQVPMREVRSRIRADLGRPVREVFRWIDPIPLGCASLAVVHKATTVDGRVVAIKVLRPGIHRNVATDLQIMQRLLPPLARATGLPLDEIVKSLRAQLAEELDLRNEARTMRYFRQVQQGTKLDKVYVPEPYPELSGRNVLTMEFLDGVAVDDLSAIEELGVDPTPIVEQVVKAWFLTALTAGVFHGDAHAGNIMILRDGRIAVLDWGIVGRLSEKDLHFFRGTIRGALGDDAAVEEVVDDMLEQWLPVIQAQGDYDPAMVRQMMVATFGLPLKQPFGQVSLADMIAAPQRDLEQIAQRSGVQVRSAKEQRKALRGLDVPELDRSLILLAKQLAYFERYGKMYLSEIPLLHDEEFFGSLVGYSSSSSSTP